MIYRMSNRLPLSHSDEPLCMIQGQWHLLTFIQRIFFQTLIHLYDFAECYAKFPLNLPIELMFRSLGGGGECCFSHNPFSLNLHKRCGSYFATQFAGFPRLSFNSSEDIPAPPYLQPPLLLLSVSESIVKPVLP